MLVAITTINNCSIQQKKSIYVTYLIVSVLDFRLLYICCGVTGAMQGHVHTELREIVQCMYLVGRTCDLCCFFFYATHINDEYCLVLVAAMKLTVL